MINRLVEDTILGYVKYFPCVGIVGARQVGKTTFALQILGADSNEHPAYLNWDFPPVKEPLLRGELPANQKLIVLDEIHKYRHKSLTY